MGCLFACEENRVGDFPQIGRNDIETIVCYLKKCDLIAGIRDQEPVTRGVECSLRGYIIFVPFSYIDYTDKSVAFWKISYKQKVSQIKDVAYEGLKIICLPGVTLLAVKMRPEFVTKGIRLAGI